MVDPLTAIGIAASLLQLGDVAARLSIKLFTVGKQIKNAPCACAAIPQEVGFTSSILKELSGHIQDDGAAKVHNQASLSIIASLSTEAYPKSAFLSVEADEETIISWD